MGKKRVTVEKTRFLTSHCVVILLETLPFPEPPRDHPHMALHASSEQRLVNRHHLEPGAGGRRQINSSTSSPSRRLAPWTSASSKTAFPSTAAACFSPPGPAPSPPPAGPPGGCASRKLPAPLGPLLAAAPPPRDPEQGVIGPAAPSLSGSVTAPVSDRGETGSGVSARRAAAAGSVQSRSLPFARRSARSPIRAATAAAGLPGCKAAGLQAQPPPEKQRQLVPVRDGERAKLTGPRPTRLSSRPQVRYSLREVPARGPAPGVHGTPRTPRTRKLHPKSKEWTGGRCPERGS